MHNGRLRKQLEGPRCPTIGKRESLADAAKAEIFYFEVVVHTVFGAFAAQAGFFEAAEGGDFGGDHAGVDADDAVLESFGDAEEAGDIAAVEIGGETELGVVGERDGFGFGFEAE